MEEHQKPISELLNFSIINLDKPSGPTSFDTSDLVRKMLGLKKTSHFGTLDPKVTGVLPIALGRACKLNDFFMHKDKEYVGIMHLHESIQEEKLREVIKEFIGKIMQLPPVRSNVKRQLRQREIISFEILEIEDKDVLFKTKVQAGTYIRKLCDDIGKKIGGAHMLELRRTQASIFKETDKNFINLYQLEEAVKEYKSGNDSALKKILIPAQEAIKSVLPIVQLNKDSLKQVLTGKPLMKNDLSVIPEEEVFAVFLGDKFIEIAKKSMEKEIIARPLFVFN
jgi:H/ACA ribonucleoprotein complex subunit 4